MFWFLKYITPATAEEWFGEVVELIEQETSPELEALLDALRTIAMPE